MAQLEAENAVLDEVMTSDEEDDEEGGRSKVRCIGKM